MTSPLLNVLVLGVGGNVSQGILKALALADLESRVIAACVSPLAAGLYTADLALISPPADDPGFLDWLLDVCRRDGIDAVLSGVEPVLARLAPEAERIRSETGAVCVVSPPEVLAVGDDKLETSRWLAAHGLNFPRSAASEDAAGLAALAGACGYPLLAKPRAGKGMHGVFEIADPADLARAGTLPGYVIQELLGTPDTEYTVGCFCDRDGHVAGSIAMRRHLLHGTTYRAEAGDFPEVTEEAVRIAAALRPRGPCNVQLRVHQGRPMCFEVNVRFSGTTPVRARFGFNEVEASLRHYVLGEEPTGLGPVRHGHMLRYWNEVYVDTEAVRTLAAEGRLDNAFLAGDVEDFAVDPAGWRR